MTIWTFDGLKWKRADAQRQNTFQKMKVRDDGLSWASMSFFFRQNGITYAGPRFNIKTTSYQYRKSHCGDKTILRPSYLHNGISYTGKTTSLYWIKAQMTLGNTGNFSVNICEAHREGRIKHRSQRTQICSRCCQSFKQHNSRLTKYTNLKIPTLLVIR